MAEPPVCDFPGCETRAAFQARGGVWCTPHYHYEPPAEQKEAPVSDYIIDPARIPAPGETGIYIRARDPNTNKYDNFDISQLDKASLKAWLRSRGGDNPWAEDVIGILLGHGHLHQPDKKV